ncbi:MAG: TonB-dependent receptor [Paludibacter sp.]|nr:TonB-dependent receptor [Paludibacter sp.]
MKKTALFFYTILFLSASLQATIRGKVTDAKGVPVMGVNIYWSGTTIGVASGESGEFSVEPTTATNRLVFSNVSFNSDTVTVRNPAEPVHVVLSEVIALSEVSVVTKNLGTIKGRTSVVQTEKITAEELCKAACCNLSESFETNPSVDVTYSDAATGAKQIKMLGLSGAYVQMLTENIPNLRGISAPYGLGFIPGPWMESIQVSKGTASVVNGYEAITGQINVEYKKPQTSEIVAANVFASDAGRVEANVNASAVLSPALSTGILLHASDEFTSIDDNGDGFMDIPMVKQYNFINRWYYKKGDYISQAFFRALSESRMGGQVSGNYHIGIETERYEFFLKNGYIFNHENDASIGFIVSGSLHTQNALYGLKKYDGEQGNLYANFIYQRNFGHAHKLSTGASFNFDDYNETLFLTQSSVFPRREYVPGIFAEYTLDLHDKLIVLAGIRGDYNSRYGSFVTPRLHLKYNLNEHLHFRGSAGKGFRSPNVLAENNYLLASNRALNIEPNLKMEQAWNYGLSAQSYIHLFGKELSLTGEWYYTNFREQVVVDMDSDPHAVSFSNLNGKSFASSGQVEANMEVAKGLTMTLAHRINDVKTTIGGVLREKPLTNRSKSLITASYQTPLKQWQLDATVQFNGGGRLPDPDPANSFAWEKEFQPYTIANAQVTKYFKTWSVYLGSENITSFVQKNPIVDVGNPFSNNFDASMVWGPMHGRKLYVGFRWALARE